MPNIQTPQLISALSGKPVDPDQAVELATIRRGLLKLILSQKPDIDKQGVLHFDELNDFREQYFKQLITSELGALLPEEEAVLNSLRSNTIISESPNDDDDSDAKLADKISDRVANFVGSWAFIISFLSALVFWILLNTLWFTAKDSFDPYPFILLNLVLSCIAAIQAPLIMMAQNRKESKDRTRATNDYKVNLKAEIEIRQLHEKIDALTKSLHRLHLSSTKNNKAGNNQED